MLSMLELHSRGERGGGNMGVFRKMGVNAFLLVAARLVLSGVG